MFILFDQIPCVYEICGPRIFGFTPQDVAHLSDIFDELSLPMIMYNLNKLGLSPRGVGGILPHLSPSNTRIFLFMLCNRETHFGRFLVSKLTTHSPKMMNDHNHAPTPTMWCHRAYEMQHAISCQIHNMSHL